MTIIFIGSYLVHVQALQPTGVCLNRLMKIISGTIRVCSHDNHIRHVTKLLRQFGDVNPNSIEASYYERTINATYSYGADHIHGEHHVYSLFYGISNVVPASNSRRLEFIVRIRSMNEHRSILSYIEISADNNMNMSGKQIEWVHRLYAFVFVIVTIDRRKLDIIDNITYVSIDYNWHLDE
jgi:hypothetical protein